MKRLALLGLLLTMTTGCGCGLLSGIFRGAPCQSNCGVVGGLHAPAAPACTGCGTTTSYGSYGGEVVGDYYGGEVLSGDYYGGTVVETPMEPIQAP